MLPERHQPRTAGEREALDIGLKVLDVPIGRGTA
jgi:hypothetical protein